MNALSQKSREPIYVEINEDIELERAELKLDVALRRERGGTMPIAPRMTLSQGNEYKFVFVPLDFGDGRPESIWVVLMDDPHYGLPISEFRRHIATKRIETAHEDGRPYKV